MVRIQDQSPGPRGQIAGFPDDDLKDSWGLARSGA
jgi:hypothetical protein